MHEGGRTCTHPADAEVRRRRSRRPRAHGSAPEPLHHVGARRAHARQHVRRRRRTGTAGPRSTRPGSPVTTPRSCIGRAVLLEDRQVDPRQVVTEPRAPDHGRRPRAPAVLEHRHAVRDRHGLADPRCTPAASELLRLHPHERVALSSAFFAIALRPIGVRSVSTCTPMKRTTGTRCAAPIQRVDVHGDVAAHRDLRATSGACARQLERDVGARVARAHHEHAARRASCDGLLVLARVQLRRSRGPSSCANAGTRGSRCAPVATITFAASNGSRRRSSRRSASPSRRGRPRGRRSGREDRTARRSLEVVGQLVLGRHVRPLLLTGTGSRAGLP